MNHNADNMDNIRPFTHEDIQREVEEMSNDNIRSSTRIVRPLLFEFTRSAMNDDSGPRIYNCLSDFDLGKFTVSYDGSYYKIDTNDDHLTSRLPSQLSNYAVGHCPHDLVLSLLSDLLDKDPAFYSYFGVKGDGLDKNSPDIIYNIDGIYHVCEIGTTRHGDLTSTYSRKHRKYHNAVKARTQGRFLVLIVGGNSVCCNFDLNEDQASLLVRAFRIGLKLQEDCKKLGWQEEDDQYSYRRTALLRSLDEMINLDASTIKTRQEADRLIIDHRMKARFDMSKSLDYNSLNDLATESIKKTFNESKYHKESYQRYCDKIDSLQTRNDMKSIVTMPGLLFDENYDEQSCSHLFNNIILLSEEPEVKLWKTILNSSRNECYTFDENYEDFKDVKLSVDEARVEKIKNREIIRTLNRVKIRMDINDSKELALNGLNGRMFSNESSIVEKREKSKLGFSMKTNTDDIDDFCLSNKLFEEVPFVCPEFKRMNQYYTYATEMGKHKALDLLHEFSTSKFGHLCSFQSALASELNINIRKPTKRDEFILIKMRMYPVWIIMHNTGSSKHSFYSLLVPKYAIGEIIDNIFTPMIDSGDFLISELRSTREHDLSMHLGMYAKQYAKISLMYQTWDVQYERGNLKQQIFLPEILSTYLIEMENKENTSSSLMNVRYMYMEMIDDTRESSPFKVMKKFPDLIRSRLLVWFIKNIGFALGEKKRQPKKEPVIERRYDDFENEEEHTIDSTEVSDDNVSLVSICSRKPLPTFEAALCLSYLGVYHNKDKAEEIHGKMKIFVKIISQELEMRNIRDEYIGVKEAPRKAEPDKLRSHEFNYHHVVNIGRNLRNYLSRIRPDLIEKIINDLLNTNYEDLATFKASADSSQFTEQALLFKDHISKKRPRTLEEILRLLNDFKAEDSCPYVMTQRIYKELLKHGGIRVNLFKKNQKTGVREIFVLIMLARILIRLLEGISRSLCEVCPHEYLTKGKLKSKAVSDHYIKANKISRVCETYTTVSDSLDMTTWAQKFIMPIFSSLFHGIFDTSSSTERLLLDSVDLVLNLMTEKKLELPHDLLNLFVKNEQIVSMSSEEINELKAQFLGNSKYTDLLDKGTVLMKNRSNMMQGILHYTSSLLHAAHLLWHKSLMEKIIRRIEPGMRMYTTIMCSSDDAGRIMTLGSTTGKPLTRIRAILKWTSHFLKVSYPLIGVEMSDPKSSLALFNNVYEFNSSWYYKNTQLSALIKWSQATTNYKLSTSVPERQLMDHNLLNDMMAHGSTTWTNSVHELACAINHHDCMGLYTSTKDFWDSLLYDVTNLKNPMMWFYLLSHNVIGTILGYRFTRYWNLCKFSESRMSEFYTRRNVLGDTSDAGEFNIHTKLTIGDNRKYNSFLKRIDCPSIDSLNDEILREPSRLFSKSSNTEETKLAILLKARSFGAEKAFCFESASKQHATSAYVAKRAVIRVYKNGEIIKMNLPSLIVQYNNSNNQEYTPTITDYPMKDFYDQLIKYYEFQVPRTYLHKKRKITLSFPVPRDESSVECQLLDCAKYYWFRMSSKMSKHILYVGWTKYKAMLPWLSDDFHESYEAFKLAFNGANAMQFVDYLKNFDGRSSTITISHRGKVKTGLFDMLTNVIDMQYDIKTYLIRRSVKDQRVIEMTEHLERADQCLYHLQSSFRDWNLRRDALNIVMSRLSNVNLNLMNVPKKYRSLALIAWAWNRVYDYSHEPEIILTSEESEEMIKWIRDIRRGRLITYVQEQTKVKDTDGTTKYKGVGVIMIVLNDIKVRLTLRDEKLIKLETTNPHLLEEYKFEFEDIINRILKIETIDFLPTSEYETSMIALGLGFKLGRSKRGLPIIHNKDIPDSAGPTKIGIKFDENNALSIMMSIGSTSLGVVRHYPKLIGPKSTIEVKACVSDTGPKAQCFRSWINNRPCEYSAIAATFMKHENIRPWMKATFYSRLAYNSMLPNFARAEENRKRIMANIERFKAEGCTQTAEDEQLAENSDNFDDESDDDLMDFLNDDYEADFFNLTEAIDDVEKLETEVETEDDLLGFLITDEDTRIRDQEFSDMIRAYSQISTHKAIQKDISAYDMQGNFFWDKFINYISKKTKGVPFKKWNYIPPEISDSTDDLMICITIMLEYFGWVRRPIDVIEYGEEIDEDEERFKLDLQLSAFEATRVRFSSREETREIDTDW